MWKRYKDTNYEVSHQGEIRNIKTGRVLKGELTKNGYIVYNLFLEGKNKRVRAHRMVAEKFLSNEENYPIVNHKDCNKTNNNVDNLEWCSYSHNTKHAMEHGLVNTSVLGKPWNTKLTKDDVEYIRSHYAFGDKNFSLRALGKRFNVNHKAIERIVKGITWKE